MRDDEISNRLTPAGPGGAGGSIALYGLVDFADSWIRGLADASKYEGIALLSRSRDCLLLQGGARVRRRGALIRSRTIS